MACAGRPRLLQVVLTVLIKDLLIRRQLTLLPPVIVLIRIVMVILAIHIGVYATQTVITLITLQDPVQITCVCILVVLPVNIWVTVLLPTKHTLLAKHPKTLQAGRTAAGVVYQVLNPAVHILIVDVVAIPVPEATVEAATPI